HRVLGTTHASIITYNHNWCLALDAAKQFGKATQLRRESVAIERQRIPISSPRLAGALDLLGKSLLRSDRPAEAEQIFSECLALREKGQPDSWLTFDARTLLGAALAAQKKHAEAATPLLTGYEGMRARQAQIPPSLRGPQLT